MPLGAPCVGAASYQPRAMEGTFLHRVVREHFETFRAEIAARSDDDRLPQFVERYCFALGYSVTGCNPKCGAAATKCRSLL